jgi:hypothetical protein
MRRVRVLLVTGLLAVAGVAATASSASAQEPNAPSNENASCIGVLSSFVGAHPSAEIFAPDLSRPDFAGQEDFEGPPGQSVHLGAQFKSVLPTDPEIIPGLPNATLSCVIQTGL